MTSKAFTLLVSIQRREEISCIFNNKLRETAMIYNIILIIIKMNTHHISEGDTIAQYSPKIKIRSDIPLSASIPLIAIINTTAIAVKKEMESRVV